MVERSDLGWSVVLVRELWTKERGHGSGLSLPSRQDGGALLECCLRAHAMRFARYLERPPRRGTHAGLHGDLSDWSRTRWENVDRLAVNLIGTGSRRAREGSIDIGELP
jgi:hypothetical protein